jgi:virginiamycin B lyase
MTVVTYRTLVLSLAALALACLASLALAARAEAFVYWADPGTHSIGRANLDGTGVQQSFIAGIDRPTAVAVDNHYIYWADQTTETIGRANLDGTGADADFIPRTGLWHIAGYPNWPVTGLAVGEYIFWSVDSPSPDLGDPTFVGRAGPDGGNVQLPWGKIGSSVNVHGVEEFNSRVFVSAGSKVWGLQYFTAFDTLKNLTETTYGWMGGLTRGDSYIFWLCDEGLWRVYPLGFFPEQVAAADQVPGGDGALAKQDAYLYWADDTGSRIGRIGKDGSGSTPDFLTAPVTPLGVAADGGKPATVTGLSAKRARRGERVTITGRHFGKRRGPGVVRFGRALCGRYLSWSDHTIVVAVPAKSPLGRVKLVVRTKYGPTSPLAFTVNR